MLRVAIPDRRDDEGDGEEYLDPDVGDQGEWPDVEPRGHDDREADQAQYEVVFALRDVPGVDDLHVDVHLLAAP